MTRARIASPAMLPVTLAQAKAHMRIDGDVEDEYLLVLMETAVAHVEAVIAKALIAQTWRVYVDELPRSGIVDLPVAPVLAIEAILCHDAQGNPRTIDPASALLDRYSDTPRLMLKADVFGPVCASGLEIDVRAGFGDTGADVPGQIRRALLVLVAHWHAFRGQASDEALFGTVPRGFETLLAPWRPVRL